MVSPVSKCSCRILVRLASNSPQHGPCMLLFKAAAAGLDQSIAEVTALHILKFHIPTFIHTELEDLHLAHAIEPTANRSAFIHCPHTLPTRASVLQLHVA